MTGGRRFLVWLIPFPGAKYLDPASKFDANLCLLAGRGFVIVETAVRLPRRFDEAS